ncbi:MAG TPA: hypothetical protein RMG45_30165, partial [Polyangiaceae bacterium LLY-WYZ-15_(1-7)]|nr:hypothetical protein [Polyangiaceae bacterium LLY-WYZ-15_(1-7)]
MADEGRWEAIQEKLAWFAEQDAAATVFGASQHRWRLGPALDEDALAAFEAEHGVALPPGYRGFLRHVGNGGAGPFYGLSPLAPLERDTMPSHHVVAKDAEGNVLAAAGTGPRPVPDVRSSLARPFPLTERWAPADGPAPVPKGASLYDGCVHLAEQGCGYFDFLVVRGEAAGEVWSDYTAGDGPMAKAADDFLGWYERWLEGAQVEWLQENAIAMALWAPRHHAGIDECVRLLDEALAEKPEWGQGWRVRGYVHLNREEWEEAGACFAKGGEHGRDEPRARLHLDRARLARFQGDLEAARREVEEGLEQAGLWASTETELGRERLLACDGLGDVAGALACLEELAARSHFTLEHHFELARRRLERGEGELAWELLDQAVEGDIGPNRGRQKATRRSVYGDFAAWLREAGH